MSLRQVLDLFDQLITMARVAGQDIRDHQPQIAMTKIVAGVRRRRVRVACFFLNLIYLNYI